MPHTRLTHISACLILLTSLTAVAAPYSTQSTSIPGFNMSLSASAMLNQAQAQSALLAPQATANTHYPQANNAAPNTQESQASNTEKPDCNASPAAKSPAPTTAEPSECF